MAAAVYFSRTPCIADIGILVSTDPIAIDQACIDLVYGCKDPGREHFLERIESRLDCFKSSPVGFFT
ncbi:MAG: hypothetical protein ACI4CZ_10990 [Hominisplanchenecus sp.]